MNGAAPGAAGKSGPPRPRGRFALCSAQMARICSRGSRGKSRHTSAGAALARVTRPPLRSIGAPWHPPGAAAGGGAPRRLRRRAAAAGTLGAQIQARRGAICGGRPCQGRRRRRYLASPPSPPLCAASTAARLRLGRTTAAHTCPTPARQLTRRGAPRRRRRQSLRQLSRSTPFSQPLSISAEARRHAGGTRGQHSAVVGSVTAEPLFASTSSPLIALNYHSVTPTSKICATAASQRPVPLACAVQRPPGALTGTAQRCEACRAARCSGAPARRW